MSYLRKAVSLLGSLSTYYCRFCGAPFETESEGAIHSWTAHGEQ